MLLNELNKFAERHQETVYLFFRELKNKNRELLLQSDVINTYENFLKKENKGILKESILEELVYNTIETVIRSNLYLMNIRIDIGKFTYLQFDLDSVSFKNIEASEFLFFKEELAEVGKSIDDWSLEIDITPFNREFPRLLEPKNIGKGVEFLNRHLASKLFFDMGQGSKLLLNFLKVHKYKDTKLMLTDSINSIEELRRQLRRAINYLYKKNDNDSHSAVKRHLKSLGFEEGWGKNVGKIKETMEFLVDILEAPEPGMVQEFLSRIPMIFNIVIISPHGYFAQSNVFGKPDTGGQVVYILNQVKALEDELINSIEEQGLDIKPKIIVVTRLIPEAEGTTCNEPEERIFGTKYAKIKRIPFRYENGEIVKEWISRFHIWPFIERFAIDAEKEILAELGNKPDFFIGNYSDGSLVGYILSKRLGITNCMIAHALEKTKYLFSDLYWKDNEERYKFSAQFTADLIAMNTTDFIITSTYQEIAGSDRSIGQYESYQTFTMPSLYRVINGIELYDPKFNIVSPGPDENIYFPYYEKEHRLTSLQEEINKIIFQENYPKSKGNYKNKDKPIIFALSRIDYIKNIRGLVSWFAESKELRENVNLLIISTNILPEESKDEEELNIIRDIHEIIDNNNLEEYIRWVGGITDRRLIGEIYRCIADMKGGFVQPALFEAFGLTVVEAMISGLPTFATKYGGPSEIIENNISGFHIDPNNIEECSKLIVNFFKGVQNDTNRWYKISENAINRVKTKYSWKMYAKKLLSLSKIYGFWKYTTNLERQESSKYFDMFYALMFRRRAEISSY
ncbi:MAG: sucrose synthase [Deferribacterota bacterium]|nr:sucrose synthase [Deferribacterota bacterium]